MTSLAYEWEKAQWRRDDRLTLASAWARVAIVSRKKADRTRATRMLKELLRDPDMDEGNQTRAQAVADLEALS